MAEHWIRAQDAARIVGNTHSIRSRLAAGMIRFQAHHATVDGETVKSGELPTDFWAENGREPLQEHWETGDFISNHSGLRESRAIGVLFAASDVLDILPIEQRPLEARSLSVAGNSDWVPAREARRYAYSVAGLNPMAAGRAIIDQCRSGFIVGRAVEMCWSPPLGPPGWAERVAEWDIPIWFWEYFTAPSSSSQDWERGRFSGRGQAGKPYRTMELNGVHFLRASLASLLPTPLRTEAAEVGLEPRKPALSEADFQRWWDRLGPVRDQLGLDELVLLVRGKHPDHFIARDRIRALAGGRKTGPKPK